MYTKSVIGAESSRRVMDFLEEHGMENKLSNRIGIAIETTYQSEDKEELAIDNIMMLKAVSKKMEYQRVIGLNKTTVIF